MVEVTLADAKPGDTVTRMLAGTIPMKMRISKVHEGMIFCHNWTFDQATGMEEDAELRWGRAYGYSGSFIAKVEREEG